MSHTAAPAPDPRIGVYYEHPDWFEPLFEAFDRRGVPAQRIYAPEHHFDPVAQVVPFDLVLNRMSPSAFTRGHGHAIPYTLEYLAHLEALGANVLNGLQAYRFEFSKARQVQLMGRLGVRHPRARVIHHAAGAPAAAQALTFPVIVKPNVGGSGAGIRRFDTPEALQEVVEDGTLDLGPDHVALVQEYVPPRDASIVRVEVLGGRLLYAIRLRLEAPDSFNLCPADYCRAPEGEAPVDTTPLVEAITPPPEAVDTVLRLTRAAGIEVGGVEYLVDDRSGELHYYDVNAMSNFVADAPNVVGFDPFETLVDYALARADGRPAFARAA